MNPAKEYARAFVASHTCTAECNPKVKRQNLKTDTNVYPF